MRRASTYFQLASRAGPAQTHPPCPLFTTAARILLRPLGQSLQSGVLIRSPALLSNDFDVNCGQPTAQRWRDADISVSSSKASVGRGIPDACLSRERAPSLAKASDFVNANLSLPSRPSDNLGGYTPCLKAGASS